MFAGGRIAYEKREKLNQKTVYDFGNGRHHVDRYCHYRICGDCTGGYDCLYYTDRIQISYAQVWKWNLFYSVAFIGDIDGIDAMPKVLSIWG